MGSWDGCREIFTMAHVVNELLSPMSPSWPTEACKKCHASPRIGPLGTQWAAAQGCRVGPYGQLGWLPQNIRNGPRC